VTRLPASAHSELVELLRERSFRRGTFTLASGRQSPYYVDARLTTMSARGIVLVGGLGLAAIRNAGWGATLVGGLTLGADPVAYAIAAASARQPPVMDAFTVRKEPKDHGTGRRIEGPFRPGATVVIVEDVITTGDSARRAIDAVVGEGGRVAGVLAVVDREEGGREALEGLGHSVVPLVRLRELTVS
jgi:orotate phosphoribosyltransferase